MNLTIVGGGSLGHVCAAVASTAPDCHVSLMTGHPDRWGDHIVATDPTGECFFGKLHTISADPSRVIPSADIVLLCLPGYLIESTLERIKAFLTPNIVLGSIVSSTGFFFQAHRLIPNTIPLFGFQRVPYIARVAEYGHSGLILGYKKEVSVAIEHYRQVETLRSALELIFRTPTRLLHSFYEAALTNSNPILHTGRLYTLWHQWNGSPYDHQILFYREWDLLSAQTLIDMDSEFMQLLTLLPVTKDAIPSLLEYYESTDAASLAAKIRSIPAFQAITAPMKETENGWVPDYSSRYFTEDFPYGLKYIKDLASKQKLETPNIDRVLQWGLGVANQRR